MKILCRNGNIWGLALLIIAATHLSSKAQSPFDEMEALFTTPRHYTAVYADEKPTIDGDIMGSVWQAVPWSKLFISIKGYDASQPDLDTRMKIMWDDQFLFVAAKLEEPHVWATLKERDAIIYYDNDFEVFIDPDNNVHQYFEIEVNAFNTIFDLFMAKPYRNGSRALISWNIAELQSAVQVQGTLNDPTDVDHSWTVEMAIPLEALTMGQHLPTPDESSLWRINFSRVQWETTIQQGTYVKKKTEEGAPVPAHNWVWSPQGVVNMHYPERWGYLTFAKESPKDDHFELPVAEKLKRYLWLVYYKQRNYVHNNGHYASTLDQLNLSELSTVSINHKPYRLQVEATTYQFGAMILTAEGSGYHINQDGYIQQIN